MRRVETRVLHGIPIGIAVAPEVPAEEVIGVPVAVVVGHIEIHSGDLTVAVEILPGVDPYIAIEVGMVPVHPLVHDGDHHRAVAADDIPGLGSLDLFQVPLHGGEVVRIGGRRAEPVDVARLGIEDMGIGRKVGGDLKNIALR